MAKKSNLTLPPMDNFPATPLLRLRGLEKPGVEIYAKAEWYNPSGSVKFRPALNIVEDGQKRKALSKKKTIIDASSGNTGAAYAVIGKAKGYQVELVMPKNVAEERKRMAFANGAVISYSDPLAGSDGAIVLARKIVEKHPDSYFYADQYSNDANWQAHYKTTGPEIWRQTNGRVTHFVAGLGTTGSFMGNTRFLKEKNPSLQSFSMEPAESLHGMEGLKHMATAIVPGIYQADLATQNLMVSTDDAYAMQERVFNESGLRVSISAAGSFVAVQNVMQSLGEAVMVTLIPAGDDSQLKDEQNFFEIVDRGAF